MAHNIGEYKCSQGMNTYFDKMLAVTPALWSQSTPRVEGLPWNSFIFNPAHDRALSLGNGRCRNVFEKRSEAFDLSYSTVLNKVSPSPGEMSDTTESSTISSSPTSAFQNSTSIPSIYSGYGSSPPPIHTFRSSKVGGQGRKRFKCRHDCCGFPPFRRISERNIPETSCGGYVCKGRRKSGTRLGCVENTRQREPLEKSNAELSFVSKISGTTTAEDQHSSYGNRNVSTNATECQQLSTSASELGNTTLFTAHPKFLESGFPQQSLPEIQIATPVQGDSPPSRRRQSVGAQGDGSASDTIGIDGGKSKDTPLVATLSGSSTSSNSFNRNGTQISDEKKKEIIEEVMETFHEMNARAPGSWFSSSLEEEEGVSDTEYDTESDTLSWDQRITEVATTPETGRYSVMKANVGQENTLQDQDGSVTTSSACHSQTSASQMSERYSTAAKQGKRKVDETRSPHDDEDDNGNRKKRQRTPGFREPSQNSGDRKFACPYTKRFPNRTVKAPSCVFPGYPNISRLKGHLYRTHMRPLSCLRCHETFQDEASLGAHYNAAERCTQVLNAPEIEGITPEQERQLKSKRRTKGNDSEEKRWERVYLTLFPGETEIPSPYCNFDPQTQCFQMSPSSADLTAFEQFSRENLRAIVERRLEIQTEREDIILEGRLRSMVLDIVHMVQEEMLNSWREHLSRSARGSENVDASEDRANNSTPAAMSNQDTAEGNILDHVLLTPPADHADALGSFAEILAESCKPGPADSGIFSFDSSRSALEHPENARTLSLNSPGCAPLSPQLSPTVADDSQPAEGSFEVPVGLMSPAGELDETLHGNGYPAIAEGSTSISNCPSFDLDSRIQMDPEDMFWAFNDQQI